MGLALVDYSATNAGTFSGFVASASGDLRRVSGRLAIEEPEGKLLVPFVSTEVRLGYRLTPRVSADLGAALTLFLPQEVLRARRAGLLSGADRLQAGVLTLPTERLTRPFVALRPSLAIRVEL
jgi:hypothetical protein